MLLKFKHSFFTCLFAILPVFVIAQKITITGSISSATSKKIVFEKLKEENSWNVWKDSNYEAILDSTGSFNVSIPISENSFWRLKNGKKRTRLHLNLNQNIYLEFDKDLVIRKVMRQDLIDSPIPFGF